MVKHTEEELIAVLCGLYIVCGGSVYCRKRPETIRKKAIMNIDTRTVKKALKILWSKGLVEKYGGTDSYRLTKEGARLVRMICEEFFENM